MSPAAPSSLLWFVAGFGIWSLGFVLLYAVQAIGCDLGWHRLPVGPVSLQRVVLVAILAVHVAALAIVSAIAHAAWRNIRASDTDRFIRTCAVALSLVALASTVWTGFPVIVLRACIGA